MSENKVDREVGRFSALGLGIQAWVVMLVGLVSFISGAAIFVSRLAKSEDVQAVVERVTSLEKWQVDAQKHDQWVEEQLLNIAGAVGATKAPKK